MCTLKSGGKYKMLPDAKQMESSYLPLSNDEMLPRETPRRKHTPGCDCYFSTELKIYFLQIIWYYWTWGKLKLSNWMIITSILHVCSVALRDCLTCKEAILWEINPNLNTIYRCNTYHLLTRESLYRTGTLLSQHNTSLFKHIRQQVN